MYCDRLILGYVCIYSVVRCVRRVLRTVTRAIALCLLVHARACSATVACLSVAVCCFVGVIAGLIGCIVTHTQMRAN